MLISGEKKQSLESTIDESFKLILTEAHSIRKLSAKNAIQKIEKVETEFELLSGFLLEMNKIYNNDIKKLDEELKELLKIESKYTDEVLNHKKKQTDLDKDKDFLNEKKNSLLIDFNNLNEEINEKNEELEQEMSENDDDTLDSIPIFGFFNNISNAISNKNPEKLIPFNSNGLTSLMNKDKKAHEEKCKLLREQKEELNKLLNEIEKQVRENIKGLQENAENLRKTKEKINEINKTISVNGVKITATRNISKNIQMSRDKFSSFKTDLMIIKEGDDDKELDSSELDNFINDIHVNRKNFLETK